MYYQKTAQCSQNIIQKYKPGYEVLEIGLLMGINTLLLYKVYQNTDTITGVLHKTIKNLRNK